MAGFIATVFFMMLLCSAQPANTVPVCSAFIILHLIRVEEAITRGRGR